MWVSMIPEVVVFDLGKVLVDYDYTIAARNIAPRCKVSLQQLQALLDESPLFAQFESGLIGNEEFFSGRSAFERDTADRWMSSRCISETFSPKSNR